MDITSVLVDQAIVPTVFSCVASPNKRKRSAPGYRGYGEGTLSCAGHTGYSWASAISNTHSMCLVFYMTILNPDDIAYRSYGFQLRCLSE